MRFVAPVMYDNQRHNVLTESAKNMFAALWESIRQERDVGVPRRFSMGTIFVLLTFFALLFRFLVLCGAPANVTGVICSFVAAVAAGQMLLFRGARPRAASVVIGALTCPAILVTVAIDELSTKVTGMTPIAAGLDRGTAFFSTCILLALVGLGLGYFVGGMVASIFYVLGKVYPQTGLAGAPIDDVANVKFDWMERWTNRFATWGNPHQPKTPIRGAVVKLVLVLLFGLLITPYVNPAWITLEGVMLIAFGFGAAFVVWSGNEQLWLHWPILLMLLGSVLGGTIPCSQLKELPIAKSIWQSGMVFLLDKPLQVTLWCIGGLVGLTVSGLAGWSQWAFLTRRKKEPFSTIALLGFAVLLLCINLVAAGAIRSWVNSPTQQLFARIIDQGGYPQWSNPFAPGSINGIQLMEQSSDSEFREVAPLLTHNACWWIQLRGHNFTDASTQALDGIHTSGLMIEGASLTDAAFRNVKDTSATYLTLTNMPIGDALVADLMKQPLLPKAVSKIDLTGTQVTDATIQMLSVCPMLQRLTLSQCEITDAGLANLKVLPKLEVLNLSECPVTDAGMAILVKAVPGLRELHLNKTAVTDIGLMHLSKLRSLRSLRAQGTAITQSGTDELERLRPQCSLIWDDE